MHYIFGSSRLNGLVPNYYCMVLVHFGLVIMQYFFTLTQSELTLCGWLDGKIHNSVVTVNADIYSVNQCKIVAVEIYVAYMYV